MLSFMLCGSYGKMVSANMWMDVQVTKKQKTLDENDDQQLRGKEQEEYESRTR